MKIYFGGDSFLYGYGLKREDALPYLFSKYKKLLHLRRIQGGAQFCRFPSADTI